MQQQMMQEKNGFGLTLRALFLTALVIAHAISLARPTLAQTSSSKIVFDSTRDGNYEIYIMNPDGTGQTNLTHNAATDSRATISRDATKVAFTSARDGNEEIYIMNADGTGQTRLTTNAASDTNTAFNRQGSKIVFSSRRDGNEEIYVMNVDGTGQSRLTNNAATDTEPTFGPDDRIYWGSTRDGNEEIYVMNGDGTNQTRLTNNTVRDADPTVSASGKIAFHSDRAGALNIYIMDNDGSGQTRLTSIGGGIAAAFSPDESQIAFYSLRDGNGEIYVMNADGTTQTRITNNPASDGTPNWGVSATGSLPALTINDVTVTEGDFSNNALAIFTIKLSKASSQPVKVNFATQDGSASAGKDYTTQPATSVTFAPGAPLTQTIAVAILNDDLDEPNENFKINLSNSVNATITKNQGVGTIVDDDPTPRLSISDVTVTEGDSGTVAAIFHLSLSAVSGHTVTVTYKTVDGTAKAPGDYVAHPLTTLTFTPGQTGKTVTVKVSGDMLDEANETFKVVLQSASFAALVDTVGVATITDDDPLPSLALSDAAAVSEDGPGAHNALFTVTLAPASGRTVTVSFATANDSATAGADYTATSGTVTFNAGQTSKAIVVPVLADTLDEANETFRVNLTGASFATVSDSQGVATITDNDPMPALTIDDVSAQEGNSNSTAFIFTVTLSAVSGRSVTVAFASADGTATKPADYAGVVGTLTFAPGTTSKTITVAVKGDTAAEPDEAFLVNLSSPVGATLADGQGQGTITNDDAS